eukprot:2020468-Heterocapsa_arctica.AAC.1
MSSTTKAESIFDVSVRDCAPGCHYFRLSPGFGWAPYLSCTNPSIEAFQGPRRRGRKSHNGD